MVLTKENLQDQEFMEALKIQYQSFTGRAARNPPVFSRKRTYQSLKPAKPAKQPETSRKSSRKSSDQEADLPSAITKPRIWELFRTAASLSKAGEPDGAIWCRQLCGPSCCYDICNQFLEMEVNLQEIVDDSELQGSDSSDTEIDE